MKTSETDFEVVDGQQRLCTRAVLLSALAEERFGSGSDETLAFIDFIPENCYVVEVVSDNLESAFRMFSALNSRGVDLSPVDLVKSKIFKNKTTSLKVSKLKGGKKYYVRVCTYKKAGGEYYYSAWSKAKAVKTKK